MQLNLDPSSDDMQGKELVTEVLVIPESEHQRLHQEKIKHEKLGVYKEAKGKKDKKQGGVTNNYYSVNNPNNPSGNPSNPYGASSGNAARNPSSNPSSGTTNNHYYNSNPSSNPGNPTSNPQSNNPNSGNSDRGNNPSSNPGSSGNPSNSGNPGHSNNPGNPGNPSSNPNRSSNPGNPGNPSYGNPSYGNPSSGNNPSYGNPHYGNPTPYQGNPNMTMNPYMNPNMMNPQMMNQGMMYPQMYPAMMNYPQGYNTSNNNEGQNMHPSVVNVNTEGAGMGYGAGCGYGLGGVGGGALLGGLLGAGLAGGFGGGLGYGAYRGLPVGGVGVGDMYGAAETNKSAHAISSEIHNVDRDLSHKMLLGDFATLQKLHDTDLKNSIAHMSAAKEMCDMKADLKSDILENRHLNTVEHCATREKIGDSTTAILWKMAQDREQELRDQLLIERTKCNRAEDTIINNKIINGLSNLDDLDARITRIVYSIVNGTSR